MIIPATDTVRVFWGILIVLVVGYLIGTWLNRRRSERIGRWVQSAVGRLGGHPAWKFLRSISSGAQVSVPDANAPFRQFQIAYGLLTRELPPLWALEWMRGRRDTLAVRANLRTEPGGEIEVVPLESFLRRQIDRLAVDQPWTWQIGPAGLGLATRGELNERTLAGVRAFLDRYGTQVQRLSLRPVKRSPSPAPGQDGQAELNLATRQLDLTRSKTRPHLLLFMSLGRLEHTPAGRFFDDLRTLARAAESGDGRHS